MNGRMWIAAIVVATGLSACKPELARLDVEVVSAAAVDAYVDADDGTARLPAGTAIVIEVRPVSETSRDYDSDTRIDLQTRDPAVARVFPVYGRRWQYVITGVSEGRGGLGVFVDDDAVGELAVIVASP